MDGHQLGTAEVEDLINRVASNVAAHAEQSAVACDGRVEHWHGISLCDARSPHWYRNVAAPTRPLSPEESDKLNQRLFAFYGVPPNWVIATVFPVQSTNGEFVNHLNEELMYCAGDAVTPAAYPDLEIREAGNGRDMEDFEQVWATSYGHFHLLEPAAVRYNERVLGGGHRIWVGYIDGEAVATSVSYVHSGINLIRGVTTLPQYRGRGIGSAMTAHAMSASDLPRVLNSEPGVENMYKKLGFEQFSTFSFWSSTSRS